MSSLQEQARALGDPTRHRVFRHVTDAGRPVGVAELAEQLGVHHNAVRQHLAKLVAAGLLVASTAPPAGPGRPRLQYEPTPDLDLRWGAANPYEHLSHLLAEVLRSGRTPEEVGAAEGRARAAALHTVDAAGRVFEAMARDGFEPELAPTDDGIDVLLHRCPFESAALIDPTTVCALHLGMARGLIEGLDAVVLELVPGDPPVDACRLRIARAEA